MKANRKANRAKFCTHVLSTFERHGKRTADFAGMQQFEFENFYGTLRDQEQHVYAYAVYFRFKPLNQIKDGSSSKSPNFISSGKINRVIQQFNKHFEQLIQK